MENAKNVDILPAVNGGEDVKLVAAIYVSHKANFEKDELGQLKKATMAL